MPGPLFLCSDVDEAPTESPVSGRRLESLVHFTGKPRPFQRTRPKTASTSAISRTKRITIDSCQIVTDASKVMVNPETKTGIDLYFMTSPLRVRWPAFCYNWPSQRDMRENRRSWEKGQAVANYVELWEEALADLAWDIAT